MSVAVLRGDARSLPLPDGCVDLIVTSPPFWALRSYTDGGQHYADQIGSEPTWQEYIANLLDCTREWIRVLKPMGSLFVELGDKYSTGAGPHTGQKSAALAPGAGPKWVTTDRCPPARGLPPKCLMDLPHRYAIACVDELGLIKRAEIPWHHVNGLPESVTDRVRRSHSMVFHFTRLPRYYAAVDEIREEHVKQNWGNRSSYAPGSSSGYTNGQRPAKSDAGLPLNPLGKLPGSVWDIPSQPLTVPPHLGIDHFAAFPMELPRRLILGWSPPGVCTGCGEGRQPVVRSVKITSRPGIHVGRRGKPLMDNGGNQAREGRAGDYEATITGYACACPQPTAPTTPAIVLDPFGGTGTTALVAAMHGRTGITIDRSADYCRLAAWRTTDPGQRAAAMQVPKPPPVPDGMEPLFGMETA